MSAPQTTETPTAPATIPASWSVNETLLRHPETIPVFNAFGVEACCGGEASLADAAADAGVPLDTLLRALGDATAAAAARPRGR